MNLSFRISLKHGLVAICALWFLAGHAVAGAPKERVINIEAAMRTWQERYSMISTSTAYWEARSDLIEPGAYPEDGFYGQDLLDPQKAAYLVDNLYLEMRFNLFRFLNTPASGDIASGRNRIRRFCFGCTNTRVRTLSDG